MLCETVEGGARTLLSIIERMRIGFGVASEVFHVAFKVKDECLNRMSGYGSEER